MIPLFIQQGCPISIIRYTFNRSISDKKGTAFVSNRLFSNVFPRILVWKGICALCFSLKKKIDGSCDEHTSLILQTTKLKKQRSDWAFAIHWNSEKKTLRGIPWKQDSFIHSRIKQYSNLHVPNLDTIQMLLVHIIPFLQHCYLYWYL